MKDEIMVMKAKEYKGEDTNVAYLEAFRAGLQDEVISTIYVKNVALFHQVTFEYKGLSDAEVKSIIMEQIWICLKQYDATKSKGKISSMIVTYIKNACRNATKYNNANSRKVNEHSRVSFFSEYEGETERIEEAGVESSYSTVEMEILLSQLKDELSDKQYKYCLLALEMPTDSRMADYARELNITRAGALQVKKTLQKKLKDLVA